MSNYNLEVPNRPEGLLKAVEKLMYWAQVSLPAVYGEELTYAKEQGKMAEKINELVSQLNVNTEWTVYLLNQGVENETIDYINLLIQNGTLGSLINNELLGQIQNNLNSQIGQFKEDVNKQLKGIASGAPQGVASSVETIPAGADKTRPYLISGGSLAGHWVYWNGSSWVDGGVYQSSGIEDKSITPNKLSFLSFNGNLLNPANFRSGGYTGPGGWVDSPNFYDWGYIKIENGKTYSVGPGNQGNQSSIYLFNEAKTNVGLIERTQWNGLNFTIANVNAVYMSLPCNINVNKDSLMMVEGSSLPINYVPYGYKFMENISTEYIEDKSVTPEKTSFIETSVNLWDKNNLMLNGYYSGGVWTPTPVFKDTNFVAVKPNTTYSINLENGRHGTMYFYGANKNYIGQLSASQWNGAQFTTIANCYFVTIPIYSDMPSDNLMIVEGGTIPSSYVPCGYYFNITISDLSKTLPISAKKFLLFGDSITQTATYNHETGGDYVEGTRSNWPKFTFNYLKSPFKNYAYTGAAYRTRSGLDVMQTITNQVQLAIDVEAYADIVCLNGGTNDLEVALGDYKDTILRPFNTLNLNVTFHAIRWCMVKLREKYPNALFFISTPTQKAGSQPYNDMIEGMVYIARHYNFVVIPTDSESNIVEDFEVSGGAGVYLSDGLHPSVLGQKQIAAVMTEYFVDKTKYFYEGL